MPKTTTRSIRRPPAGSLTLDEFIRFYPRIAGAANETDEEKAAREKQEAEAAKAKAEKEAEEAKEREKTALGEGGKAALDAERKARKEAEKKAKDAQARIDELEKANLSETERLKKEAEDGQNKATQATERLRKANLLTALADNGITGVKSRAAARLIEGVEYDDNDEPTNLPDAIKASRDTYGPEVFGKATTPPPDLNAGGGGNEGDKPNLSADELAAAKAAGMTPEEYQQYQSPQPKLPG